MKVGCFLVAVALAGPGCARMTPGSALGQSWAPVVNRLRTSADLHVRDGELLQAADDLRRIFLLPVPVGEPGAVGLLQDARFALGSVFLLEGRFDDAVREAERGLNLGEEATIFCANLYALRAMALEAKEEPLEALADYSRALAIHKALFDQALAEYEG